MRFSILIPLAVLGVAMAQGPGQVPPGPGGQGGRGMAMRPPQLGALKAYLNLTDTQIEQMRKAREEARKQAFEQAKAIQPQIREKRAALRDLLAKDTADATTVGKAMLEIQALHKQMRQAHEAVRESLLKVLTPEQQAKFKSLQDSAQQSAAAHEAARLGLVPGGEGRMGFGGRMGPGHRFGGPGGEFGGPEQGFGGQGMGMRARGAGQGFGPGRGMGPGRRNAPCPCMQGGPQDKPPAPPAKEEE